MKKLSIVIPVYNEERTLPQLLSHVEMVHLPDITKEIIIVDDASRDGTPDVLKKLESKYRIFYQTHNQGKGAAVRRGLMEATGDFVVIQDADLEYNPHEYPKLLEPIVSGKADVVYGSRFIGGESRRVLYFWHSVGNRVLTTFSNILTDINLTDMETCYKLFTKEVLAVVGPQLTSNRFGIEPELTAAFARHNFRIYEVGISYSGRTYKEGKKINWKDGVAAFWHIIKFNLLTRT